MTTSSNTSIQTQPAPLSWDVYVAELEPTASDHPPPGPRQFLWQPIAATLISVQQDAILANPLLALGQAGRAGRLES